MKPYLSANPFPPVTDPRHFKSRVLAIGANSVGCRSASAGRKSGASPRCSLMSPLQPRRRRHPHLNHRLQPMLAMTPKDSRCVRCWLEWTSRTCSGDASGHLQNLNALFACRLTSSCRCMSSPRCEPRLLDFKNESSTKPAEQRCCMHCWTHTLPHTTHTSIRSEEKDSHADTTTAPPSHIFHCNTLPHT